MISNNTHIIHKVFVEVDTNSSAKANDLRANINDFVQKNILDFVEEYFSKFEEVIGSEHIQIEKLNMNLEGKIDSFDEVFIKEKVFQELEKTIDLKTITSAVESNNSVGNGGITKSNSDKSSTELNKDKSSGSNSELDHKSDLEGKTELARKLELEERAKISHYSPEERTLQSIIYFVKTGKVPWWIPSNAEMVKLMKEESLIELVENKGNYFNELIKKEVRNSNFLKRLIHQLSDDILLTIFASFYHSKPINFRKVKSLFQSVEPLFKQFSTEQRLIVWTLIAEDTKPLGVQKNRVEAIFPKLNLFQESSSKVTSETSAVPSDATISKTLDALDALGNLGISKAKTELVSFVIGIQSITQLLAKNSSKAFESIQFETKQIIENSEKIKAVLDQKNSTKEVYSEDGKKRINPEQDLNEIKNSDPIKDIQSDNGKARETSRDETTENIDKSEAIEKSKDETIENTDKGKENSKDKLKTKPKEKENFIAENTGLILLHPFIKMFFKKFDLLNEDNELTDPILAVHCLHYAATGKNQDYEFAMTFEKYLCGIPLSEPLPKDIELSQEMKDSIDELLEAVLGHWKALKTKSIDLLRNEFLRREGKIFVDDISPRIVIERKTIDIMLDQLPWSLSIVGLPWKKELIYVEW